MHVVVAIDSFKGSLSSVMAGNAVKEAVLRLHTDAKVTVKPLADGGEGTVDALSAASDAQVVETTVTGPLGDTVRAKYCILRDSNTAVIEMAAAAGITLVPDYLRNPLRTTTFGVGELIRDAIDKGCRRFIIGIGGSATNDGGVGMLSALGFSFTDENGIPVERGAAGLRGLRHISVAEALPALADCSFRIACDVTNPLCGETGCSAVYGPQKGADAQSIRHMDTWLASYATLAKTVSDRADMNAAGAGAAGGLGFAFLTFLNGKLQSGVDLILEELGLEAEIQTADIVVTGEGRLDAQTVMGKAPVGVAKLAKRHKKPVIAFSGCIGEGAERCNEYIDAYFPILQQVSTLEQALETRTAYENLKRTAYQVFRLLAI